MSRKKRERYGNRGDSVRVSPGDWIAIVGIAVVLLVAMCGCCGPQSVTASELQTLQDAQEKILGEYLGYVEADPELTDTDKDARKLHVEALRDLTKAALEEATDE